MNKQQLLAFAENPTLVAERNVDHYRFALHLGLEAYDCLEIFFIPLPWGGYAYCIGTRWLAPKRWRVGQPTDMVASMVRAIKEAGYE